VSVPATRVTALDAKVLAQSRVTVVFPSACIIPTSSNAYYINQKKSTLDDEKNKKHCYLKNFTNKTNIMKDTYMQQQIKKKPNHYLTKGASI
jgi:hypothetical protein